MTNPKGTLLGTRVLAAGRGSVLGLVTARSFSTLWRPVSRILEAGVAALFGTRYGTCLTRFREPGQRSSPTRETSLGLVSRRLCLGAESLVFRSPVTSSWGDGAGLVHVGSGDHVNRTGDRSAGAALTT